MKSSKSSEKKGSSPQRLRADDLDAIDTFYPQMPTRAERVHQLVEDRKRADAYLKSSEPESLKDISNSYPNCRCTSCKNLIPIGQKFLWGRDHEGKAIRICIDCQINNETDKTIVNRLLKRKRLEREVKALTYRKDQLADEIEEASLLETMKDLAKTLRNACDSWSDNVYGSFQRSFYEALPDDIDVGTDVGEQIWEGLLNSPEFDKLLDKTGIPQVTEKIDEMALKVDEIVRFYEAKLLKKAIKH